MKTRTFLVLLACLALAACTSCGGPKPATSASAPAQSHKILVVGDSWAAGIFGFKAFEEVFKKYNVTGVEIVGQTTALGGSRADQWAKNHKGKNEAVAKLDALDQALKDNPTIDMVHLSIGGNDFLKSVMDDKTVTMSPDQRKQVWERICKDIETLVNHIAAQRPGIKVCLSSYDYLDPALMRKTFNMPIPEDVNVQNLNQTLLEFAQFERDYMKKVKGCSFIQHFGLLQHYYGNGAAAPKDGPLPGMPPKFDPFHTGNPDVGNSAEAMPDGVHPMPQGYVYIIDRCYQAYYKDWIAE